VRRTIAGIGRTLITLGLLILLFVAYQLWGTGIWTARAQDQLKGDFAKAQRQYDASTDTDPSTVDTSTTVRAPSTTTPPTTSTTATTSQLRPAPPIPPEGDAEGWITIPRIGLNMVFVEGTSRDDLKKGPGHYPGTPLPGTLGNAAIAGHRTTYLHPFYNIDQLVLGDEIKIQTVAGTFYYEVFDPADPSNPPGLYDKRYTPGVPHQIVKPTDTWVVDNTAQAELTLSACNPKYSAAQRIIIKAKLMAAKSPKPPEPPAPKPAAHGKAISQQATLSEGLSGQARSLDPAVLWGIIAALVGVAWWWLFRRWRHPLTWALGVIPFLVVLFPFYVYLERALPAGY